MYPFHQAIVDHFMHCISRVLSWVVSVTVSAYECQPGQFQCAGIDALDSDGCVPDIYLCDGHEDCTNGQDEEGCDCKCPQCTDVFGQIRLLLGCKLSLNLSRKNPVTGFTEIFMISQ